MEQKIIKYNGGEFSYSTLAELIFWKDEFDEMLEWQLITRKDHKQRIALIKDAMKEFVKK